MIMMSLEDWRYVCVSGANFGLGKRILLSLNYAAVHDKSKLGAAASIAASGTDVLIVKCESVSAEQAIRGEEALESGSLIRRAKN